MNTITIEGQLRTGFGKSATRQLRSQEMVPGVIYGGAQEVNFYAPAAAFKNLVYTPSFQIAEVKIDGKTYKTILKDLQFDKVNDMLTHVDLLELVEGKNLAEYVEEKGRLPELEAIRLVSQVAQGLHRAHKLGLVHRDVKPENILISTEGQAKLTDLGLVKEAETDLNLTRTGRGLGTPHFMAPEQFKNAKLADSRCDIYSLGSNQT